MTCLVFAIYLPISLLSTLNDYFSVKIANEMQCDASHFVRCSCTQWTLWKETFAVAKFDVNLVNDLDPSDQVIPVLYPLRFTVITD